MKHTPREHQRAYLTFYLRVFEGDMFLGFIIDISRNGFMVMTENLLTIDKYYMIRMKVPSSLEWKGEKDIDRQIEFTARCCWSRHDDVDKEFYLSGFEFTDLEESDNEIIHRMIKEYKIA